MRRREFITLLGSAVAWPLAARAQQPVAPVIGFISNTSPDAHLANAFRQGLSEAGFIDGENAIIEYRWTDNDDSLPALVSEFVRRQVLVIATGGLASSLAAKAATTAIPIVFATGGDPVQLGLVASLNRPGGNVTGVSFLANTLIAKRFELLHELVPNATKIAFLTDRAAPTSEADVSAAQTAARLLSLELLVPNVGTESAFEAVFAALVQQGAAALVIDPQPLFTSRYNKLVALAACHAVPTMYHLRDAVEAGGLMSYGASFTDAYRQAGIYAGRILKGEKPADLPMQQSTKVELVINLKTARALGIPVPLTLLAFATEVLE
jgi:putative ABC transport system substrate-binding protein